MEAQEDSLEAELNSLLNRKADTPDYQLGVEYRSLGMDEVMVMLSLWGVSLITLFIVPCVFCAIEEWKWRRARRGK